MPSRSFVASLKSHARSKPFSRAFYLSCRRTGQILEVPAPSLRPAPVEEAAQDTPDPHPGALDVLAQHILALWPAPSPAAPYDLFAEVRSAAPYRALDRETFDKAMSFVATGGYALRAYERFAKIVRGVRDGMWRVLRDPLCAAQQKLRGLNGGTPFLGGSDDGGRVAARAACRQRAQSPAGRGAGGVLGEVEAVTSAETLLPGDTCRSPASADLPRADRGAALVSRAAGRDGPKIPSYARRQVPALTLTRRGAVRGFLADSDSWARLTAQLVELTPGAGRALAAAAARGPALPVETFPPARAPTTSSPTRSRAASPTRRYGMLRLTRPGPPPLERAAAEAARASSGTGDVRPRGLGPRRLVRW